ncbi:hypothetical protein [Thalassobius sp. MITS945101]|uniref:hypothetical protein n=1 Tax=Thalassobius sp. MITS945101 TaxID=3096994 RepID=UPI003999AB13
MSWFDPIRTPLTQDQLWNAHRLALGPAVAADVIPFVSRSISLGNLGQRDLTFSNFFDAGKNILRALYCTEGYAPHHTSIDVEEDMERIEEFIFDMSISKAEAMLKNYCLRAEARLGLFPYISVRSTYMSVASRGAMMGKREITNSYRQLKLPFLPS